MSILKEHDDHTAAAGLSSFNVIYIFNYAGSLEVGICTECPYVVVMCEHTHNIWLGNVLVCTLCGADGT